MYNMILEDESDKMINWIHDEVNTLTQMFHVSTHEFQEHFR